MPRARFKLLLGVDIHDAAVHACRLRATDMGPEILDAWTEEISEGGGHFSDRAAEALRRIVRKNRLNGEKACVTVPDSQAVYATVILPSNSRAELQGMVELHVEQQALFPANGAVAGFTVLHPVEPAGSRVGIASASRLLAQERVDIARAAGLTPSLAVTGGLAAARYFAHYIRNDQRPAIVLYGESGAVCIYVISAAGLLMAHTVPLDDGAAPSPDAVIRGIRLAAENAPGDAPGRIIMCGDARGIPHPSVLELELGLPVSVSVGDEYTPSGLLDTLRAAGAALEMDPAQNSGANLAPRRERREARGPARARVMWAALIVFAILIAAAAGYAASVSRARADQLRAVQKRLDALEPRLDAMRKQKEFLDAFSSSTAPAAPSLDALLALSETLPENVFVTNLVVEPDRSITATAETSGQETVALVLAAMEAAPAFDDVQLVYSRRGGEGGAPVVTFEIKAAAAGERKP